MNAPPIPALPAYGTAPDVNWSTSDLCDLLEGRETAAPCGLQVLQPGLVSYGGHRRYFGQAVTLAETPDAVPLLSAVLGTAGLGRVLVVQALPENTLALLGDRMAALAIQNGWAGVIVGGFVRDRDDLHRLPIGIHALGTCPQRATRMKDVKPGGGVDLLGARIGDGAWVYADADGVIVLDRRHTTL